jgi:Protein required for attachment to host cells
MKTLPSLIILADRGRGLAYEPESCGLLKLVHPVGLLDGHRKLSAGLTDKAGAFRNEGTFGQGNSSGESQTLVAEINTRLFREIAREITVLLSAKQAARWAFAAPSEINDANFDGLDAKWKQSLAINLPLDLTTTAWPEVAKHFQND